MSLALNFTQCGERLHDEISTLTDKKIKLINLKITIDRCLKKLPRKYAEVIKLYFRERKEPQEIAELTGYGDAAVCRHLVEGITELSLITSDSSVML